jgi:flavin-binding protein dodecin
MCLQKARERCAQEATQRQHLASLQAQLQLNPNYDATQEALAKANDQLQALELFKVEGQRIRGRVKWRAHGDRGSKEFYQSLKTKSSPSSIKELLGDDEQLYTQQG